MRRLILFALGLAAALVFLPGTAVADSSTHTYMLEMDAPNFGVAANGDRITIEGHGEFGVNPKFADAAGTFQHRNSSGALLAAGSWRATELLEYQSYGCGEVFGDPLPPPPGTVALCGGAVKMRVTLTPTGTNLQIPGTMTVLCVIGPNPPDSVFGPRTEGVTLIVPGIENFNHSDGGENIYIQTS